MDSGNSSGMQSSSAGDEEYDSKADSTPADGFFNLMAQLSPPVLRRYHQQNQPPTLFDQPTYGFHHDLDAFPEDSGPNIILNKDVIWPAPAPVAGNVTSDPNCTTRTTVGSFGEFPSSSSSVVGPVQSPPQENGTQTVPAAAESSVQSRPKKRMRASRRAPTTVLTTDTSNFRAMVQEFTGIAAPPFSAAASSPYSRRLDLLGTARVASSLRTGSNPFRPSAQKFQPSSSHLLTTANMVENLAPSHDANNNNILPTTSDFNSSSNHLGVYRIPENPDSNVGNQNFPFQSLMSSPFPLLKYSAAAFGMHPNPEESLGVTNSSLQGLRVSQDQVMNTYMGGLPATRLVLDGGNEVRDHPPGSQGGSHVNCAALSSNFHTNQPVENGAARAEDL
ncbi:hypothetical protein Nepgr_001975 [Nepenthes gracilis]|uniref:VQ domain-containing protein n=1 Tax=Nepenthes gracilis TaxID=150966 RepID=A0AAD3P621_NEPGR|nr:hypothetical protein Nepgr_001975 [Nepenthes gracilis]